METRRRLSSPSCYGGLERATHAPFLFALLAWSVGCADKPMDAAERLHASGDARSAARLYKGIAKKDPANLAAWDLAVDISCRELAEVGECLGVLDLELELLGKIDRHHAVLAEAYHESGDVERAEVHWSYAGDMDHFDTANLAVVRRTAEG